MYDSDKDYVPKLGDDESDSDDFEPTISSKRNKTKNLDYVRPTTRKKNDISGLVASVSTVSTSPATNPAVPARPDAGHRRRRHHHEDDGVACIMKKKILQEYFWFAVEFSASDIG